MLAHPNLVCIWMTFKIIIIIIKNIEAIKVCPSVTTKAINVVQKAQAPFLKYNIFQPRFQLFTRSRARANFFFPVFLVIRSAVMWPPCSARAGMLRGARAEGYALGAVAGVDPRSPGASSRLQQPLTAPWVRTFCRRCCCSCGRRRPAGARRSTRVTRETSSWVRRTEPKPPCAVRSHLQMTSWRRMSLIYHKKREFRNFRMTVIEVLS